MRDHGFAGGFVDSPGAAAAVLAAGAGLAAAAAFVLPSPQPAREMAMASRLAEARGIRIIGEHPASCGWTVRAWHAKPQHHAKDLHLL
jgi:hypothetical protein